MLTTLLLQSPVPYGVRAHPVRSSICSPLWHRPPSGFTVVVNANVSGRAMKKMRFLPIAVEPLRSAFHSSTCPLQKYPIACHHPLGGSDLLAKQHLDITGYNFNKPC